MYEISTYWNYNPMQSDLENVFKIQEHNEIHVCYIELIWIVGRVWATGIFVLAICLGSF